LAYRNATEIIIASDKNTPSLIGGQAYFISDGTPINQNEFFRPLCEARGVTFPTLYAPVNLMLFLAFILERIHLLGEKTGLFSFEPFMTRTEVNKVNSLSFYSHS
jgi:hypothetical protein